MTSLLDIPSLFGIGLEPYFILFMGTATFLLWKWILEKRIKERKTRNVAALTAALISTSLITAAVISLFISGFIDATPRKQFSSSQWLTDHSHRFQMADDITDSKMLIGKDTSEVKQILGDPNYKHNEICRWDYDMGSNAYGFGVQFHILLIQFQNGEVAVVDHARRED